MSADRPGFQELVRILESAAGAGVRSIRLEYESRNLIVLFEDGNLGIGVDQFQGDLTQAVVDELWKYARPGKSLKVALGDKPHRVTVEKYENFGEWEFLLTLEQTAERKRKR